MRPATPRTQLAVRGSDARSIWEPPNALDAAFPDGQGDDERMRFERHARSRRWSARTSPRCSRGELPGWGRFSLNLTSDDHPPTSTGTTGSNFANTHGTVEFLDPGSLP
jgi:hypothetical protein